jgi:hypothetical protein
MSEMLQKLQLSVCALRQDRGAEGLHDLLDGHGLARELILGRTAPKSIPNPLLRARDAYQTRPKAPMPTGCKSVYLRGVSFCQMSQRQVCPHLLVISKVVPKIWARTNLERQHKLRVQFRDNAHSAILSVVLWS